MNETLLCKPYRLPDRFISVAYHSIETFDGLIPQALTYVNDYNAI